MLSQARKANRNRQAVLKEHAAYHNTNPAGLKNQLSVYICPYGPLSVYGMKVDFVNEAFAAVFCSDTDVQQRLGLSMSA